MSALPDELPARTRIRPWRLASSVVVVGAAAVAVLPDLLQLDRRGPFAQLVAFRPALVGGALVLATATMVSAGIRRRGWVLAGGLLGVSAVGAAMVLPRALPAADVPAPDGPPARTLTVLAFNAYEGQADVDALATLVRAERPDLISLPEAGGRYRDRLAPLLPDYRFASSQERGRDVQGVTAAVRADLGEVTVAVDESTPFPNVTLGGPALGTLRFVAFHSVAPTPGAVLQWRHDLGMLSHWCADRGSGPVIVAGDFNATLDHSVFRDALTGCADAAERVGNGLVGTWPRRFPRWLGPQIDHVVVAGAIVPETFAVHDIPGSDHRAVVSRLRLPS